MAQFAKRSISETFLTLENPETGLYPINHIYEPEFHQEDCVSVVKSIESQKGSFQIGGSKNLVDKIHRGLQPQYADDETDPSSMYWLGMTKNDGSIVKDKSANICALKSVCVRAGYIDFETARSVTKEFYQKNKKRAGIVKNDVLINSTGDGTIGRVAVYNHDHPALVDGHISILRFDDEIVAWYIGAFLMSNDGQKQISRYINGSSGQVEIYPQDIARIWIRSVTGKKMRDVAMTLKNACDKYDEFTKDIKTALSLV